MSKLALYGGTPILKEKPEAMFHWPIVNDAMRQAQTNVLNAGNMNRSLQSGTAENTDLPTIQGRTLCWLPCMASDLAPVTRSSVPPLLIGRAVPVL